MYVCELCREQVEPDQPDVVAYVEQAMMPPTFGSPAERVDRFKVLFHRGCAPSPRDPNWRVAGPDD